MASDPSDMHSLLVPRRLKSLVALLALTFAAAAAAQAPTVTPEQLQIFSNLTPEEQRALMEQVASPDQQGAARQPSSTNQPPPVDESRRRTTEDQRRQPEVPVMKSEDTVLVEARVP